MSDAYLFLVEQMEKTADKSIPRGAAEAFTALKKLCVDHVDIADVTDKKKTACLAENCADFVLAMRQAGATGARAMVLIDTALATVESLPQLPGLPKTAEKTIGRALKTMQEALPHWPKPGSFTVIHKIARKIDATPVAQLSRIAPAQFDQIEKLRYRIDVATSDAAQDKDLATLIDQAKNVESFKGIASEPFSSMANKVVTMELPFVAMQASLAAPLPDKLQTRSSMRLADYLVEIKQRRYRDAG